jgi:hypothetical protein
MKNYDDELGVVKKGRPEATDKPHLFG